MKTGEKSEKSATPLPGPRMGLKNSRKILINKQLRIIYKADSGPIPLGRAGKIGKKHPRATVKPLI